MKRAEITQKFDEIEKFITPCQVLQRRSCFLP
jgi:hypothetical protein